MQYFIGFMIALFIALTGVGAGTVTVPVLVLFLGVPAPVAVGIGLMFSAAVKLILVPAQIARGNVAWRTLGLYAAGRCAGRSAGVALPAASGHGGIAESAECDSRRDSGEHGKLADCFYSFRPMKENRESRDRSPLLSWLMFPVGAEVGFSSAGAGALGSARAAEPDAAGAGADCGHGHRVWIRRFR